MGGIFSELNAANGRRLRGQKIGGEVITYTANGAQRVAVAAGFTSILSPAEVVTRILVVGLGEPVTCNVDCRGHE